MIWYMECIVASWNILKMAKNDDILMISSLYLYVKTSQKLPWKFEVSKKHQIGNKIFQDQYKIEPNQN